MVFPQHLLRSSNGVITSKPSEWQAKEGEGLYRRPSGKTNICWTIFYGQKWKCQMPVSFVEIFPYSCDQCHVSFRILDTLLRAYDRRSTPTNGLGMHNNLLIWGFLIHVKCYFFISREFISGYPTNVITQLYIASLGSINTENMVRLRFLLA